MFKKIFGLFMVMGFVFVGCSSEDSSAQNSSGQENNTSTPVDLNVSLSNQTLTLGVGDEATLTAIVTGKDLSDSDKTVTWTSSDPTVATVDNNGKISALKAGTSRITATSTKNAEKSAYCDITVEENNVLASTKTEITVGTSAAAHNFSYTGSGATIYIYSKSGGLNFYGIKVGNITWLVSDLTAETIKTEKNLTSNGITFTALASESNTMTIEANKVTIGSTQYTSRFKTGGGGSQAGRCLKISVTGNTDFIFYAVSSNNSDSRTMIVEVVENNATTVTIVRPSSVSLNKTTISLERTDETPSPTATLTATVLPNNVTDGYGNVTWSTSNASVATVSNGVVTATGAGTATITASTSNGKMASCTVTVTSTMAANYIQASDSPIGFASVSAASPFGGQGGAVYTVTTAADFKKKAEASEKCVIYVSGMIDLSGGRMPSTPGGSTAGLDTLVKTTSNLEYTYSGYNDFITKYAKACSASTNDKSSSSPTSTYGEDLWKLNKAYQEIVVVNINSNKTIIGLDQNSGLKGGSLNISSKSNIAIRNLTIQDAYDPFPHHEANDGFNAELDCIVIQGTSQNIWIDHCTLQDTVYAGKIAISGGGTEKFQTFDGLCDMKNNSKNLTVSNCYLFDHDKTMLIGSSKTDGSNETRTISLIQNYFYNCGQRLPMVRNTRLHVLNNYYDAKSPHYSQSYAVGNRENALIYGEKNYFGSGINYSYKDSDGKVYSTGDSDNSKNKSNVSSSNKVSSLSALGWNPSYTYTAMNAADVPNFTKANAGAGKWVVKQ